LTEVVQDRRIISVDNYDDVTGSLPDADVSKINTFVAGFISEFAKSKHIHYRRIEGDRFYFFTNYSVLTEFMDQKFSVLDDFRQQAQERGLPLTLSSHHSPCSCTRTLNC